MKSNPLAIGVFVLLTIISCNVVNCSSGEQLNEDLPLAFSDHERTIRGDTFSRIYRSDHEDNEKRSEGHFSRIYRQAPQPSFSRILRNGPGSFSRILRGGPASFSRILRSDSESSGNGEKRLARILRSPEFSRLMRSQTFSRILKRSETPEEEFFVVNDEANDDGEDMYKRASDFSRILRSGPSFSRIL